MFGMKLMLHCVNLKKCEILKTKLLKRNLNSWIKEEVFFLYHLAWL